MACCYALDGAFGDWLRRRFFALGGTSFGQMVQRRIWARVAARGPTKQSNGIVIGVSPGGA
jgi:hypothetical protein